MNRFHLVPRQRLLSPGNNLLNAFLLYLYTNLFHCHAVVRKQKFLCGESCKKKKRSPLRLAKTPQKSHSIVDRLCAVSQSVGREVSRKETGEKEKAQEMMGG